MTGPTGAVLLALAVVLTGCTSAEPQPPALPPAPSVSPSVAPLPLPPEAAAETAEGASEFARFYLRVLSRALQTTDARQLESLSGPGCGACRNFIGAVKGAQEAREATRGGEFIVLFAVAPAVQNGEVIADVRYERAEAQIVSESNVVLAQLPPDKPVDALIRLKRTADSWIVLGFRTTPVSP